MTNLTIILLTALTSIIATLSVVINRYDYKFNKNNMKILLTILILIFTNNKSYASESHKFNCKYIDTYMSIYKLNKIMRCENDEVVCYLYDGITCLKK